MRAQPDQMRINTRQLVEHHAQPLCAWWDLQSQQLLYREHIAEIVGHGAEIVDAVRERHDLLVELGFAGLLNPRVQKSEVRHDADHILAVDLQQQSQHAVSRGVLRAHVQDHGAILTGFDDRGWHHVGHD